MLRLHACVYGVVADYLLEFLVAQRIQYTAQNCLRRVGDYSQLHCDCHGSVDVVAGNHDGTDTCFTALLYCADYFGTYRVNHSAQAYKHHVVFDCFLGQRVVVHKRGGKYAQRLVCHCFVGGKYFCTRFVG